MMQKFSEFFSSGYSLEVAITGEPGRKTCYLNKALKKERVYIFTNDEDVFGSASVNLRHGRHLEHNGIRIELVGEIVFFKDNIPPHSFCSMAKDLEPPGTMFESKTYQWKFAAVEKPYETYWGVSARVRYFVRLVVNRLYSASTSKEVEFAVHIYLDPPPLTSPIKLEVGIEGCLHLEFVYEKNAYHLKDVIYGKVHFMLVRIKIKHMELDITRIEIFKSTSGQQQKTYSETIVKYEIMDGAAIKSEVVPMRFSLSGYDLTPTYTNIQNRFSVKYYLNLVLVDEEERRYFKRQDITFYRSRPTLEPNPSKSETVQT